MKKLGIIFTLCLFLTFLIVGATVAGASAPFLGNSWPVAAQEDEDGSMTCEISEPSGGSEMLRQSSEGVALGPHSGQDAVPPAASPAIGTAFEGFNYDDNSTETGGWHFIPPDPIGAAGTDRLIAVVNVMIEARDKTGTLLWRDSLKDFFTTLTPANWLYDPKVIYDHYENRFLVVALEYVDAGSNPDPGNKSRILLAVSKTAFPATATSVDWYYTAINSEESIGGYDYWADYPGLEVDEEAVYITHNLFAHTGYTDNTNRSRLWIVDKGVAGGFYGGSAASVTKHDPYAGGGLACTTMPAQVYGAGGIDGGGAGGTYLVSYSGLTDGVDEYVQVVRVDNPLGATAFTQTFILVGDLENFASFPDAPQLGSATDIETNDRRALDVVWRNNQLWLTTTIVPNAGSDAGQTTAHWFRLNTSTWPPTLGEQGDIGGEDIATDTYTFFPALAVNNNGDVKFGFCASATTIYAGAYATVHLAGDAPGTVRASETVRAGDDYYVRHFTGTRNRWGDYTGAALDPTDDNVVWLFNQYAMTRGSGTPPEDGRWGTAWASNLFTTAIGAPTVTTNAATLVEETTATLNGDITDTGGENCDSRGFVWGDESHSDPGNTAPASSGYDGYWKESGSYGTGTFNYGISSLSEGTKYYCRACARNSAGWSYGSEQSFLTKPDAPTIFDATAAGSTQIDLSWAKGDGAEKTKIQRKQGSYPTDRNDGTEVYFDTGTSISDTGLNSSTTYYYRAWSYVTGSEQWSDGYAEDYATTAPAQPDLIISAKYEEWVDFEARSYNITYTVKNQGGAASGASHTRVYIDAGTVADEYYSCPALDPGASDTNTVGPFTMSGDSDDILVYADPYTEVAESDEDNNFLENTWGTLISGVTTEVNCQLLDAVTIQLFDSEGVTPIDDPATSDGSGNYTLAASISETGSYEVVASKTGFRDEARSINITELGQPYQLNFRGETGLVPDVPDVFYVLECVNLWLYPEEPCGLTVFKVLAVVNAWLYPA